MKKLAILVEEVLRDYPHTRESDKDLIVEVLDKLGCNFTPSQREAFKQYSMESIRRSRQLIQASGKYKATERVRRARRLKSQVIEQNAPIASPERMQGLLDIGDYTIKPRREYN